jgi:hypothetical protein
MSGWVGAYRVDWSTDIPAHRQDAALDVLADVLRELSETYNLLDCACATLDARADEAAVHDPQSGRIGDKDHARALGALANKLRSGR